MIISGRRRDCAKLSGYLPRKINVVADRVGITSTQIQNGLVRKQICM